MSMSETEPQEVLEQLDAVHHVALPVHDLDQSVHWYRTSFCCQEVYRDRTQAILQFANLRLVLVLPSQQRLHLAFVKPDAAEFGRIKEQSDGVHSTMVSDPSGHIVELVLPEEAA
ncbi:MAG: VOC family protein [Bdellovibrionales bacterium]|nr:VOC family protein [Bdellovibrionales bacterium]